MLVENQKIKTKWVNTNKAHYVALGYKFTKMYDELVVDVADLPDGSHAKVEFFCDYCGSHVVKIWKDYLRRGGKDCCAKCQKLKNRDICNEKYGVDNVFQLKDIKDKTRRTLISKYGVDCNVAHIPEIAEKIKQTNLRKYGVEYSTQADLVKRKMRQSHYVNGNVPSSKAEREIYLMLSDIYGTDNCHWNYAYEQINMDCMVKVGKTMIDVEYDGWYWHKNRQEQDKRRNYMLIRRGFKVLRIKSMYKLPTKEQIINAIDYLVKCNHSWIEIILDIR